MSGTDTLPARFPPGRYGHRREAAGRRRWVGYLAAAVLLVVGIAMTAKLYLQYSEAPYQVREAGVTHITDKSVTVGFQVRTVQGRASCTLVARDRAGFEVGRSVVQVEADPQTSWVRVTRTLSTTALPFIGEVAGCGPAS